MTFKILIDAAIYNYDIYLNSELIDRTDEETKL